MILLECVFVCVCMRIYVFVRFVCVFVNFVRVCLCFETQRSALSLLIAHCKIECTYFGFTICVYMQGKTD